MYIHLDYFALLLAAAARAHRLLAAARQIRRNKPSAQQTEIHKMSSKLVPTRNLNLFPLHLVSTSLVYTGQVTAVPNLPARYS